jgi:flagellar basal body-associated protein FliL
MNRLPRIVAIIFIVAGVVLIVAGAVTYYAVRSQLSDEHITVSQDASHFAGKDVKGPLTAYEQADVIKKHALEAGNGKTYAQLSQDDPKRQTVMTASFLRSSLYTSVVVFGVAALVAGLGVMFILLGLALIGMLRRFPSAQPSEQAAATTPLGP